MAAAAKPTRTFLADKYFPVPLGVPYLENIGRHMPNMGAGGVNYGLRSKSDHDLLLVFNTCYVSIVYRSQMICAFLPQSKNGDLSI
jgi:hypothetical protein